MTFLTEAPLSNSERDALRTLDVEVAAHVLRKPVLSGPVSVQYQDWDEDGTETYYGGWANEGVILLGRNVHPHSGCGGVMTSRPPEPLVVSIPWYSREDGPCRAVDAAMLSGADAQAYLLRVLGRPAASPAQVASFTAHDVAAFLAASPEVRCRAALAITRGEA